MTDKLDDVWTNRDFPVLREICRRFDERHRPIDDKSIAEGTGLSQEDVRRAARNLERAPNSLSSAPASASS